MEVTRRSLPILGGVSLFLLVLVSVLWVWSYWRYPGVSHTSSASSPSLASSRTIIVTRGRIYMTWVKAGAPGTGGWSVVLEPPRDVVLPPPDETFLDFAYWRVRTLRIDYVAARVPCWALFVCFGLIPALQLLTHGRRLVGRRLELGLCTGCGYDLRASQGRCPECGQPIM
jgi:hypothetical protein